MAATSSICFFVSATRGFASLRGGVASVRGGLARGGARTGAGAGGGSGSGEGVASTRAGGANSATTACSRRCRRRRERRDSRAGSSCARAATANESASVGTTARSGTVMSEQPALDERQAEPPDFAGGKLGELERCAAFPLVPAPAHGSAVICSSDAPSMVCSAHTRPSRRRARRAHAPERLVEELERRDRVVHSSGTATPGGAIAPRGTASAARSRSEIASSTPAESSAGTPSNHRWRNPTGRRSHPDPPVRSGTNGGLWSGCNHPARSRNRLSV